MNHNQKPLILCILDGWGIAEPSHDNAITMAAPENYLRFLATYHHSALNASEDFVGLPHGQMGNSEVGHMNIGSGRVMRQELPRISHAIAQGLSTEKHSLENFINSIPSKTIHIIGLFSNGGVHALDEHILSFADYFKANGLKTVLHLITDGRDTAPQSALETFAHHQSRLDNHTIATISGRYYAMDRDQNMQRTQLYGDALINAKGEQAKNPSDAIRYAYDNNIHDEFILPTVMGDYHGIDAKDGIFIANFRSDRARQMAESIINDPKTAKMAKMAMVSYSQKIDHDFPPLFTKEVPKNVLGSVLAERGLFQLRLAETEKYAHVTFFMNGGREEPFTHEDRILINSPKVKTYDLKPEMSAHEVTDALLAHLESKPCDVVIMNFANADMVGHTGNLTAAITAIHTLDHCIGRIEDYLKNHGGTMLITADHGNIEDMYDDHSQQANTAHSLNLVPFIYVNPHSNEDSTMIKGLKDGTLADIAPTILHALDIPQPPEMDGHSLLIL